MINRLLLMVMLVACLVLSGCSDDKNSGNNSSSNSSGGGQAASPAQLRPAMGAFCDLIERCPEQMYPLGYRDREECIDIMYWLLTCRIDEDENDNRVLRRAELYVDQATISACRAEMQSLTCAQVECATSGTCEFGASCAALFGAIGGDDDGGGVGAGEDCSQNSCREGLHCAPATYVEDEQAMSCRTCQPPLEEGDTCTQAYESVPCADGLYCGQVDPESNDFECKRLIADGQPCTSGSYCESGYCAGEEPVCTHPGEEGEACDPYQGCAQGLWCNAEECQKQRVAGASCEADQECQNGYCDPEAGQCGAPDGATCHSGYRCESGYCDSSTSTCQPKKAEGEACTSAGECETGTCEGVCIATCSSDDDCTGDERCNFSNYPYVCRAPAPDGSSCRDDEDCASNYCTQNDVCAQKPQIGDACSGYGDCYPRGYCKDGACAARLGPDQACDQQDACLEPYLCQEGTCKLISLACEPAPPGDQCAYLRFCDDTAYCDQTTRECRARAGQGETCATHEWCQVDLFCQYTDTGGECAPRPIEGEACDQSSPCAEGSSCVNGTCGEEVVSQSCYDNSECEDGYHCTWPDYECVPRLTEGEECREAGDCQSALVCDRRNSPYTCKTPPTEGESCDRFFTCGPGSYCDSSIDGTCVARVAADESCSYNPVDSSDPSGTCLENLLCDGGTCTQKKALGESCASSDECAGGTCHSSARVCVATEECVAL